MSAIIARLNGWEWVAAQVILLLVLLFAPLQAALSAPKWVKLLAIIMAALGLAISFVASINLGTALTPTPVPKEQASIHTNGLYRLVRHPIYTSVLFVASAIALYRLAWSSIILCIAVYVFFNLKSRHEEKLLRSRYPEYQKYQLATGRFFPKLSIFKSDDSKG